MVHRPGDLDPGLDHRLHERPLGGQARAPLGVAIVGGMAFATLLSLFVVPAIYLGFARIGDRARSGLRQPAALEGAAGG